MAEIELIHFNSAATYASGSGISVHIHPKGIYQTDNQFILELSDIGGAFNGNTQSLSTVDDFYTPLMNGTLPNLSEGSYKLRVRATAGFISGDIDGTVATGDYGEVLLDPDEDLNLNVSNASISSTISLVNNLSTTENSFNCLPLNVPNPSLGTFVASAGSTTIELGTANSAVIINSEVSNLSVILYNYNDGSTQNLTVSSAGSADQYIFNIPDDLPIGTYNIEVQQILDSNTSNFISFSLIWHSNAPDFSPVTNNELCVGEEYIFNIDTDYADGIGRNYFGTYYTIDYGDGSAIETYTHAYILASNQFSHIFTGPSCNQDDANTYTVSEKLYNRLQCVDYEENGGGLTTEVNASEPPISAFDLDDQFCINPSLPESLYIENNSTLGQYSGASSTNCLDDAVYSWQFQKPGGVWVPIISSLPSWAWIQDYNGDGQEDLVIPYSELEGNPGCWNFKLTAENGNGLTCSSSIDAEGTVQVLELPDPDFIIQDESGNEITEICPGAQVNIIDNSNLSNPNDPSCQDVSYQWTIGGATYVGNTSSTSQNPSVIFNNPGIYEIHLNLSNGICAPVKFNVTDFVVEGTPTVSLNDANNGADEILCLDNLPYTVDFTSSYTPIYSTQPYAPSTYSWEVTGTDITAADYTFVN
ncbi:MAG: PKD domain-containing protein, partial [Pelagibacterales bacterium]|nr:PKD domain-containing protein [Pelagibacterales bacterium]